MNTYIRVLNDILGSKKKKKKKKKEILALLF